MLTFEEAISKISLTEYKNIYFNNSIEFTLNYFDISFDVFKKLRQYFKVRKPNQQMLQRQKKLEHVKKFIEDECERGNKSIPTLIAQASGESLAIVLDAIKQFNLQNYICNTEEKRNLLHDKFSKIATQRELEKTDFQRQEISNKIRKTLQDNYANMSEQERHDFYLATFGKITPKQEIIRRQKISAYQSNLSTEERQKIVDKVRASRESHSQEYWEVVRLQQGKKLSEYINSLSDKEKSLRNASTGRGVKKFYDSLSEEEYKKHIETKKEKTKNTNQKRYGVDWFTQTAKVQKSGRAHSGVNNIFFEMLLKNFNKAEIQREFPLGCYVYDFKIGNYLIEVNPSVTHNINWKPFGDNMGLGETYHRDKTIAALNGGYVCIHIFDWVNVENLLKGIKDAKLKIIDSGISKHYFYDVRHKQLVDTLSNSKFVVEVVDDGFEVVVDD